MSHESRTGNIHPGNRSVEDRAIRSSVECSVDSFTVMICLFL